MSTAVALRDALIRALVEESPDGIVLVDGSGIVVVNRQIEQFLGYARTIGSPNRLTNSLLEMVALRSASYGGMTTAP